MPKISLWHDTHTNNYKYIDKMISQQFTMGGTDMLVHLYLGVDQDESAGNDTETAIQDMLYLENRDRKYAEDVYSLRGHYSPQDNDMSLEQFGMFLSNDALYMTFHINDMVERIGRKLMPGDVLELPHLTDYHSLDDSVPVALKRFYVIDDAARAGDGYSPTWWPHLWRIKAKSMVDSQEYSQILDKIAEGTSDTTIRDLLSTYEKELEINAAVLAEAEAEVPEAGYDTSQFYVIPTDNDGELAAPDAEPRANGWTNGYLTGDGLAPNGHPVTSSTSFPSNPSEGDFVLRLDYLPNRLFRYNGSRWVKIEDFDRNSTTHGVSTSQIEGFINNTTKTTADDGTVIDERQSLSDALKPLEDN